MAEPQPKACDLINKNLAAGPNVNVSFEFFPPKTDAGDAKLLGALPLYKGQAPVFVDFTWGAGGSTSDKTSTLCVKAKEAGLIVNMHLTCTNMGQGKVKEALDFCVANGITNLVALRGDPPQGESWKPSEDGFGCALDLVKYIRKHYGSFFSIAVAGYPEGHPDKIKKPEGSDENESAKACCPPDEMKKEMAYLKEKIDAGGDFIITQLFFENAHFFKFAEDCREAGIKVPILPGMLPILSYAGFNRMTALCKTDVPAEVVKRLEAVKDDDAAVKAYGVEYCTLQCAELVKKGFLHLHFYTLNQEASSFAVLKNLGLFKEQ